MGFVNQKCCPGLFEKRVSKSYGVCQKENSSGIIPTEQQSPASEKPIIGMPNPASVFCQKMGYKLELRTESNGGQYGICIFPDGSECEEWVFFRGECGSQYKKQDISSGGQVPSSGNPSNDMSAPSVGQACIQIITPAVSPEGICKVFSTPCEVPSGWQRAQKCPSSGIIEPQSGDGTNSLSPSSQGY
ncbi:DUF333 domain-containing protein [Patescibacteria group bacterium]|nr:DUF333 domain-containing protein [Patescibacteria group bacterium]